MNAARDEFGEAGLESCLRRQACPRDAQAVMQENLKRSDKFFGGERWVLGDYAAAKPDPKKPRGKGKPAGQGDLF